MYCQSLYFISCHLKSCIQSHHKVMPDSNFIVKHIKSKNFQAIYIFKFLLIIIFKFYITLKPISYSLTYWYLNSGKVKMQGLF